MFLLRGLDDPNHLDPPEKIGVLAQRVWRAFGSPSGLRLARVASAPGDAPTSGSSYSPLKPEALTTGPHNSESNF